MKQFFTAMLMVFCLATAGAQCPTGDVHLYSQADVDAFGENWPNCSDLSGSLLIEGGNITNLSGLSGLQTIAGDLEIFYCSGLTSLNGLENLNSVDGDLYIGYNLLLTNLSGLESLSSVWKLYIAYNPVLTSLSGLESLNAVGHMAIYHNDMLTSLSGLESLDSVGDMEIYHNDTLTNLSGLENINSVGGNLSIQDNASLTSLSGLESLNSVGGWLYIESNNMLTSLSDLENLNSVGFLNIKHNPLLSVCNQWGICSYLTDFDQLNTYVFNNTLGCNSIEEVQLSCSDFFSPVSGVAYADLNCDSIFNSTDVYLPNHLVVKANGTPLASTNNSGAYLALLAPNSTTNFGLAPMLGYTVQPDTYQITTDTIVTAYTGHDFRLCPDSLFTELGVSIAALDPPQPGFSNVYHVCYENNGTQTENGTLTMIFSGDGAALLTVTDASGGMVSGNTVTWNFMGVPVFAQTCFTVEVLLSAETPLGTQLVADVVITTENNDLNLYNNSFSSVQTVVGSFDPNDKTVSPAAIDYTAANDPQRLTYTVRFQNTGTFPATFIEVLDTLEANLDIKTLELISASHAYSLTVLNNHILKFRFDNINLPDSTSDEPGSHGYVMFSLETVGGLQLGDVVRNGAAIYFDYNTPVITNIAATEFVSPTINPITQNLIIQPNPATATALIQWQEPISGVLVVTDLAGREVTRLTLNNAVSSTLDCHAWPTGVYVVRIGSAAARLVVMD